MTIMNSYQRNNNRVNHSEVDYYYDDDFYCEKMNCLKEDKKNKCRVKSDCNLYGINNENHKDCDHKKEEKHGCCCDTTTLRELLQVFRQNNTPVLIFTETLPNTFVTPDISVNYIQSVANNLVYVSSGSVNGPVVFIIPLCSISAVFALGTTVINGISEILNRITNRCTPEKDKCCCVSGIGNLLNTVSNVSLLLPLTSGLVEAADETLLVIIIFLFLLLIQTVSIAANDDIYVLYSSGTFGYLYFIVPTCKIDTLIVIQNLLASNGVELSSEINSQTLDGLASMLNEEVKSKLERADIESILDYAKGKTMTEMLDRIKLALR